MAYLRKEKETYEIAHPLDKVWNCIQKAITDLDWEIEQIDDAVHRVKVKTKGGFMSWSSELHVEALAVNDNTARVSVVAETPVTTITSLVDFGRTQDRI